MSDDFKWPVSMKEEDRNAFSKELVKDPEITFCLHVLHRTVLTRRGVFRDFCIPSLLGFPGAELLGIMHWRYRSFFSKYARFIAYYLRFLLSPFGLARVIRPAAGEKLVLVSDQWSDYYFHWFTDALPRLVRLMEKGNLSQDEIRIVLPSNHNLSFIRKSLDILGFRYLVLEGGRNHYFPCLFIPSHCGRPGSFNYSLRPTRDALLRSASTHVRPPAGKKLYISRSKARCRWIVNENEILPLLAEFGFEVVYFEDYPWEKQLEIVSQASVIIGPHGAGFTHMYFLKEGSSVIELRVGDTDDHNNCLYNMANSLGHYYYYLFCERMGACDIPGDDNLEVDSGKLRELLMNLQDREHARDALSITLE